MKRLLLLILLFCSSLTAGIPVQEQYFGPTEQLVKREGWKTIEKELTKIKISKNMHPFFNSIAEQESWGHIGYHGATQDYRVYQDIIRLTIEEILGIPVRDDFHFLRIPGDPDLHLDDVEEFYNYWGDDVDNKSKKRAKQLLSLNYGIYSNFDQKGSCSIHLFVKDLSKSEIDYCKYLTPFYNELGISSKSLTTLFNIAHKWLKGDSGILLRLSENSHLSDPYEEAYNYADRQCYPAKRGGYRYGSRLISEEFECLMSNQYLDKKAKIAPQLRILVNNRNTLNPFSHLSVQRWDLYDSDRTRLYESEMREFIKELKSDPLKVEKYREKLMQMWTSEY